MKIRQATESDLPFIDELMDRGKQEEAQGLAYPCWDLTSNFEEIDQVAWEHMFIIEHNDQQIGTVGIYDAPWGTYLVGPAVIPECHEVALIKDVVTKMGDKLPEVMARMRVDVKSSNLVLVAALSQLGAHQDYAGVSMYYELEKHLPRAIFVEIDEIDADEVHYLEQINTMFTNDLLPWAGKGVDELRENIENGAIISAILEDEQIAGAIVWQWLDDSASGEIAYICVGSQYQGKGYGRMLVDYVKNAMSAKINEGEENRIYLDVDQTNKGAQQFYESQGFVVEYLREVYKLKGEL